MALVGNISGSGGTYSTVGITGSVIFAYTDTPSAFPTLPQVGGDVVFFVSGSTTGKNGTVRNVAVFGGDTVVSGSLTIGSGSVKLTSNDIQFSDSGTRIERNGNNIKFFDASNTSGVTLSTLVAGGGGGGSGTNFFTAGPTASVIYNSGSVAFTGARTGETITAASQKGTDVIFYFSGSNQPLVPSGLPGTNTTLFGGNLVTSASYYVKDSGTGAFTAYISNTGVVSGSGNFLVGGNITLQGDLNGDVDENKTIYSIVTTKTIQIGGGVGSTVLIPGNLTVQGTTTTVDTQNLLVKDSMIYFGSGSVGSNNKGGIALASGSSVTDQALVWGRVATNTWGAGRLDVTNGTNSDFTTLTNYLPIRASKFELGGNLDSTSNPQSFVSSSFGNDLILSGTNSVTVGSAIINFQRSDSTYATLNSNNINTTTTFAGATGRQLVIGTAGTAANQGLTLSGSTVAINAASNGSVAFQRDGSGLVLLSAPSAVTSPSFTAGQTNASFTLGTGGGTTDALILSGSALRFNAGSAQGVQFQRDGTQVLIISGTNDGAVLAAAGVGTPGASLTLTLTGSAVTVGSTSATNFNFSGGTALQILGDATSATIAAGVSRTTVNIFDVTATKVNFAGQGTDISIGAATGNLYLKNATTNVSGSIVIAGSTTLGDQTTDDIIFNGSAATSLIPKTTNAFDLGSPSLRWRNMYTGDLHLKNERGNWTIIEEREYLSITNNITGKRYKFVMQEIE